MRLWVSQKPTVSWKIGVNLVNTLRIKKKCRYLTAGQWWFFIQEVTDACGSWNVRITWGRFDGFGMEAIYFLGNGDEGKT